MGAILIFICLIMTPFEILSGEYRLACFTGMAGLFGLVGLIGDFITDKIYLHVVGMSIGAILAKLITVLME